MKVRIFLLVAGMVFLAQGVQANCLRTEGLKGVNLAGAEFNAAAMPGVVNRDYVYPSAEEFAYFSRQGMNTIRLPFLWERIQSRLYGALEPAELAQLKIAVDRAQANKMCLILDLHSYGAYRGDPIGSKAVDVRAFMDVWEKLALAFPEPERVALGLSNEPHTLPIAQWANIAQLTVNRLRALNSRHLILVAGGRWSGVHEWHQVFDGSSNASSFANLHDPLRRTVIEVHQYADTNFSGTGNTCLPPDRFAAMFKSIHDWAAQHHQQLFLGEFGTPRDASCLAALDAMMSHTTHRPVWRGWTYWAAGAWWGDYPLSISPRNGDDAPQLAVLRKYLSDAR